MLHLQVELIFQLLFASEDADPRQGTGVLWLGMAEPGDSQCRKKQSVFKAQLTEKAEEELSHGVYEQHTQCIM